MTIEQLIKEKIKRALNPDYIEIINESHMHKGHSGDNGSGQTHFKLKVVSDKFNGMTRLKRHKMVMDLISPLFSKGLHAIVLNLDDKK